MSIETFSDGMSSLEMRLSSFMHMVVLILELFKTEKDEYERLENKQLARFRGKRNGTME